MIPAQYRTAVFTILFLLGVVLVITSNLQLAIGVLLVTVSYSEISKSSLNKVLDQLKDLLADKEE